MVTTRAGHAKKILGAELDDDDGDNHGMYLEDLLAELDKELRNKNKS
jgi:hypothetical protein